MHARSTLTAALAAAALTLVTPAAQAATSERFDRSAFDSAPMVTASGYAMSAATAGELCSHFIDGTPTLNAYFGNKQVTYTGTHKRARVSDGIIAFKNSFIGAQASIGLSVRWSAP